MAFCVTTAVLQMRLSVHEAVRAATYGGALALGRDDLMPRLEAILDPLCVGKTYPGYWDALRGLGVELR